MNYFMDTKDKRWSSEVDMVNQGESSNSNFIVGNNMLGLAGPISPTLNLGSHPGILATPSVDN